MFVITENIMKRPVFHLIYQLRVVASYCSNFQLHYNYQQNGNIKSPKAFTRKIVITYRDSCDHM